MVSETVLERMTAAAKLAAGDAVLEIGPGKCLSKILSLQQVTSAEPGTSLQDGEH